MINREQAEAYIGDAGRALSKKIGYEDVRRTFVLHQDMNDGEFIMWCNSGLPPEKLVRYLKSVIEALEKETN